MIEVYKPRDSEYICTTFISKKFFAVYISYMSRHYFGPHMVRPVCCQEIKSSYTVHIGASELQCLEVVTSDRLRKIRIPVALLTYSVVLVRKRTIPTERPPLVG
jgi:hypothetical protein